VTISGESTVGRRTVGEIGIWIVIFGDLVMFGLFFSVYAWYYRQDPEVFAQGQSLLDRTIGLTNTLLLLTSSLFVAIATDAARQSGRRVTPGFAGGIACGLGFVALKALEWSAKFASGLAITSSDFFMYFFTLSGIHLAHVIVGLIVLTLMLRHCQRATTTRNVAMLESGAIFWHLVDMLWVMLFALLYLVRL
jgi:nitric oxide reductase NorE protein